MLRKILWLVLPLAGWLALCGMGMLPESETSVPRTKENFAATVYDDSGVSTRLTHFSINGDTFLPARRGAGSLAIPFEQLREISLAQGKASVVIQGKPPPEVCLDRDLTAQGLSDYGPYRIKLNKIRRIVIDGRL
ncbi:MAG: hypothetical protein V2A77_08755 [Pseudomonadota bacterium]